MPDQMGKHPMIRLRDVPAELWERAKARAATEVPPGRPYGLERKILTLVDVYAQLGLPELLRRCGVVPREYQRPPPDEPDGNV